jgi:hypothetical protein
LLTPLLEAFTEEEQDDFLRKLLQHIQESSQGASAEEFSDDQLRLLDYIKINARSSDTGTSCCACTDVLLSLIKAALGKKQIFLNQMNIILF